jgi:hypothetical protein
VSAENRNSTLDRVAKATHRIFTDGFEIKIAFDEADELVMRTSLEAPAPWCGWRGLLPPQHLSNMGKRETGAVVLETIDARLEVYGIHIFRASIDV